MPLAFPAFNAISRGPFDSGIAATAIQELAAVRRVVRVRIAGESRYIPAEYAARYRDALGTPLPPGLPDALSFREVSARQDDGVLLKRGPADSGENAAHGTQLTAEGELAVELVRREHVCGQLAGRGQQRERDREIEAAAVFRQIRR